jgi:hypothetical protein
MGSRTGGQDSKYWKRRKSLLGSEGKATEAHIRDRDATFPLKTMHPHGRLHASARLRLICIEEVNRQVQSLSRSAFLSW